MIAISELKIGGIGFKRYKNLANALTDSRMGDVLIVKQDETIEETGKIKTNVEIDGGNRMITIPKNKIGFLLSDGEKIIIRNLKIKIEPQSNFIVTEETFGGKLILENIQFIYDKKADPRDWFPTIAGKSTNYQLLLNHVKSVYFNGLAKKVSINNSEIGSLFGIQSEFLCSELLVEQSTVDNVFFKSMYENKIGITQMNAISSHGEFYMSQLKGFINGLTFKEILNRKGKPFEKKREFRRTFLNDSLRRKDNLFGLFFGVNLEDFKLNEVVFEEKETNQYEVYGFNFTESDVAIQNTVIPFFKYKNVLSNSSIRLENIEDSSQWTTNGEISISNLNSTSELLGQSDNKHSTRNRAANALAEMDQYIGLTNVKEQMKQLVNLASMNAERKRRGLPETQGFSMHMVFAGSAGTGKTTMAKLLGRALYENGILATDKFVVATRKDLVAGYVGQTAAKTHELIEKAKGGVLFIDEAYSLTPQGERDFANEAVDQLVMDAEEYREDTVIILAGYTNEMKHFIDTANTGLASRFKNWIEFPDYTLKELVQILFMVLNQQGAVLGKKEKQSLILSFKKIYDTKTQNGSDDLNGNARFVRNYVQDLIMAKDTRISTVGMTSLSDKDLMKVAIEDIQEIEPKYL